MNKTILEELTVFRRCDTFRTVTDTPGLEIREQDGKCGILNRSGRVVVPFRYHNLYSIGAGQIVLCRFGKCGLLRILWDAENRRYLLRQTARCDYDAIEAVTPKIFLFRRRGRYSWHLPLNGTTSGEYRAVRILGDRFAEGLRSDYESGILCDLDTSMTYPSEDKEDHLYLGKSAEYDWLLCRHENGKCRVQLFDERGLARTTDWYDAVSPLTQTASDTPPCIKSLFAVRDGCVSVLDDCANVVYTVPADEKLRAVIRSGERDVWAKSVGFDEWDRTPRPDADSAESERITLARRALYSGDYLPPMYTFGEESISKRKWGSLKAGNAARIRREIRKNREDREN